MDMLSVVTCVTQVLIVLECCSHVSWMTLADKSTLGAGLRKEVRGKTRWVDAATHGVGTWLFLHPGHLVMVLWHVSPGYVNIRKQYAKYIDYVDGLDMLTYITSLYLNVGLYSWQLVLGLGLYALLKTNKIMY